jgi:hypothetical protein
MICLISNKDRDDPAFRSFQSRVQEARSGRSRYRRHKVGPGLISAVPWSNPAGLSNPDSGELLRSLSGVMGTLPYVL